MDVWGLFCCIIWLFLELIRCTESITTAGVSTIQQLTKKEKMRMKKVILFLLAVIGGVVGVWGGLTQEDCRDHTMVIINRNTVYDLKDLGVWEIEQNSMTQGFKADSHDWMPKGAELYGTPGFDITRIPRFFGFLADNGPSDFNIVVSQQGGWFFNKKRMIINLRHNGGSDEVVLMNVNGHASRVVFGEKTYELDIEAELRSVSPVGVLLESHQPMLAVEVQTKELVFKRFELRLVSGS